ncbi:fimbrial protein [Dyella japonica]|nr:fimbrial protein [Dyella japonica]
MKLFNSKSSRLTRFILAALLLMFFSQGSWAAWCSSGGGQAYTLTLPATIAVPRDTPAGTPLTQWYDFGKTTLYFGCGSSSGASGNAYQGVGLTNSGKTYAEAGRTYTLYDTGVPGVGMAVGLFTMNTAACTAGGGGWYGPGNLSPTGGAMDAGRTPPPAGWTGEGCAAFNSSSNNNLGGNVQVKLVTTGPVSPGVTTAGEIVRGASYYNGVINSGNPMMSVSVTSTAITTLACTTPDVIVPLGSHAATEMGSMGSTTVAVNFHISMNNCPAGLGTGIGGITTVLPAIQYRIDAATTVANSAQSVVTLDSSSSATGVGVQLLDGNGAVMPLATYKTFSGYDTTNGGSYIIPFKARYYRTGNITPGSANTSMTFTMLYQ